jgi:hypothetical protein
MVRLLASQKVSLCLFSIALASAWTVAQAQVPAGVSRPASVPEGFQPTPMGYFHPSCVKIVAKGDVLHSDELAIYHQDGSIDAMPACAYPHYTAAGELVSTELAKDAQSNEPPTIGHSWMVAVQAYTKTSFGKITTEFKVPKAPSSHDGQIIYLFPGMQEYPEVKQETIIQPVLGWNTPSQYFKGGPNVWSITSWNCCTNGTLYVSPGERVNTGDTIYGEVVNQCSAGTLECGKWTIYTEDKSNGAWTKLSNESNFGQTFNWVFGNVLEVYNVKKCSDYPEGGKLEATDVSVYNDKFQKLSMDAPFWYTSLPAGKNASPQCGYGAYLDTATGSSMTITY